MRPENPENITPDPSNGYRITVPLRLVPPWAGRGSGAPPAYLIPLIWKRAVPLPDGHQLDAWYLWSDQDPSGDWAIDPRLVLDLEQPSENQYHLQTLIHPASFAASERKYRLSCPGLFRYLVDKGGPKLWLTDERTSVGVMTDFSFHAAYGRLRL